MGITPEDGDDDGIETHNPTPQRSPLMSDAMLPRRAMHVDKDPIWSVSKQEAIRLVHVWHDEMYVMYPILQVDKVLRYAEMLFTFVEAAARSGLMQGALPGSDAMMDDQISVLKLILAITLVLEGRGKDPLGEKLFANVHGVVDRCLSEPVSLHGIILLALTVRNSYPTVQLCLSKIGHVPFHQGRRSPGLANERPRCTPLFRAGPASSRHVHSSFPGS
jgi:hypothetical protein